MIGVDPTITVAVCSVAASLGTLFMSQSHARRMASEERAHVTAQAAEDRAFQGREARYRDRNAAVVAFASAVSNEIDAIVHFEREHPNMAAADLHDEYDFVVLNAA